MWYILDMPNITADIESLKRDLERAHMDLLQMYQELGEVSFAWHDAIGYEPSNGPYGKLLKLVNEKDDVDRRIEALKTAVSEMSAGGRGIEQTKLSMKELDNRFSVLISSLGAVAIEIDSAGKLPQRLRKCLEPMRDYEHKLDELGAKLDKYRATGPAFMVSVYEKKMEKVRLGLDAVFAETGRRIYNSGDFREVPGQRAKGILDEMDQIKFAKKNFKNDILDHRSMIDEAQGSLRSMGAFGEENRKLRELQSTQNQIADKLSDLYSRYGQILAEGIPYWMDNQAPDELKKCCTQVIRQTGKIARLNLNLDHLMMEHDIEIHNMQLSQLSEQMNHLNSQIQAIENQKAELQQKVDAELKSVSDLRMKQNEITKKIAQME